MTSESIEARYCAPENLITTIPQPDGGCRELYARDADRAVRARARLAADPHYLDVRQDPDPIVAYVEVASDGTRRAVVMARELQSRSTRRYQ